MPVTEREWMLGTLYDVTHPPQRTSRGTLYDATHPPVAISVGDVYRCTRTAYLTVQCINSHDHQHIRDHLCALRISKL